MNPSLSERRLTPAMRRHLGELAKIADSGSTGEAYWMPYGSAEHRCADALSRRGMVKRDYHGGSSGFRLTPTGLEAGRKALAP